MFTYIPEGETTLHYFFFWKEASLQSRKTAEVIVVVLRWDTHNEQAEQILSTVHI